MGRPKGSKNTVRSAEEKLRIINRHLQWHLSQKKVIEEEKISASQFYEWMKKYEEEGLPGLENKKKTGNIFAALHTSKTLPEAERLRLEIARLEVEIERLKKAYFVKGVGAEKVFVISKDVNLK